MDRSLRAASWAAWWIAAALAAWGGAAAASPPQDAAAAYPAVDPQAALRLSQGVIGQSIGDYTLRDREGREVKLSDYRGKPLLVNFIYTGCFQVCPAATKFLSKAVRKAQNAVGPRSFNTVSVGFNQPFDTPQAMKAFARQQGLDLPNWEFLSPDAATLPRLTRDFGFSYVATPRGFDHLLQVTIVDAEGRVYRQVYGENFEIPMLVEPLKDLLTGAPTPPRDLAAFIEKVRLLCTVYDPASGRYRLDYGLFIEIIAGATVIAATLFLLISEWRRHRRRLRRA